ncbi:MAG: MFS transporter [Rhodospirillales bacterium]|nr:MFS transporter [Rhodospirillales bacterium]
MARAGGRHAHGLHRIPCLAGGDRALSAAAGWRGLPRGVWALGLVSLCMDASSELIHSLLPLFMVTTLGASVEAVGLVEGVAEAAGLVTRPFAGVLSDRLRRRKALALAGYGLSALTKPLFALAGGVGAVLAARFIDRIGKGIRGAPRDALVADLTPEAVRGAAFGLRQTLDTVGATLGPLLAVAAMMALHGHIRAVFWIAVAPAAAAVAVLGFGVKDAPARRGAAAAAPIRRADLAELGGAFWGVAAIAAVLALARFSEAFLVLRAAGTGFAPTLVPLVPAVMSLSYALSAYPAGVLSDRIDRRRLIPPGLAVLALADAVLALTRGPAATLAGVALWGLHMGLTQGLLSALVADAVPERLRGTGFGLLSMVSGAGLLVGSVLAGGLWDAVSPAATFWAGAGFAALALLGVAVRRRA